MHEDVLPSLAEHFCCLIQVWALPFWQAYLTTHQCRQLFWPPHQLLLAVGLQPLGCWIIRAIILTDDSCTEKVTGVVFANMYKINDSEMGIMSEHSVYILYAYIHTNYCSVGALSVSHDLFLTAELVLLYCCYCFSCWFHVISLH